jgi:membrane protein
LLPTFRAGHFHRQKFAGGDLLDALNLLALLHEARESGLPGYAASTLARRLRCDLDIVQGVLHVLERATWVARLRRHNAPDHWIMLANPKQVRLGDLYERFVLDPTEFSYQAELSPAQLDRGVLTQALSARQIDLSLSDLLVAVPEKSAVAAA